MAQNYMMGAGMTPPPAPGSPQAMNFQSDPNMRSQFKGFMSGIQAKQPAQMMPPAQPMAPSMPPQMANMDIFAAPQGFHQGGVIPALENLSQMGRSMSQKIQSATGGGLNGAGSMGSISSTTTGMGNGMGSIEPFTGMVPPPRGGSFFDLFGPGSGFEVSTIDDSGMNNRDFSGIPSGPPQGFANGGALEAFGDAGDDVGYQGSGYGTFNSDTGGYDMPSSDEGRFNAISAMAQQAAAQQRPTALDDASAYIAGLFGSGSAAGPDFGRDGDNLGNAPTAAGGITDALAGQIAQNAARQQATAQIAAAERAAMQPQIDAIAGSYTPSRDREVMDLLNARNLSKNMAQEITSGGGTVNVNPQTGQIIAANYPNAITADFTQSFNVPGTSDQGFPTVDVMAGDMAASAQGKSVMDAFQDQYNMAQGSRIMDDYADAYNRRAQMADDKYAQDARNNLLSSRIQGAVEKSGQNASNMSTPISIFEEQVGATPEQGRVDIRGTGSYDEAGLNIPGAPSTSNLGALGEGSFPTVSTESIMDRASRKDDMSDARNLVTRGFGAGMDPMAQLQARNERDIFDVSGPPGIGQAIQGGLNSIARGVTGNVLEKLEQPGSTPVYDETGQIVGVTHGGLFGGTVYTGRPDYNPTGRGANLGTEGRDEIRFNNRGGFSVGAGTGSSREAGGLDKFGAAVGDAGDAFLKMLKGG